MKQYTIGFDRNIDPYAVARHATQAYAETHGLKVEDVTVTVGHGLYVNGLPEGFIHVTDNTR